MFLFRLIRSVPIFYRFFGGGGWILPREEESLADAKVIAQRQSMYEVGSKSTICDFLLMAYSSSGSSKVIDFSANRKRICNSLLGININLARISYRFRDIEHKATHACLTLSAQEETVRINKTYPANTTQMGLLYGENSIILTSTVFD